MISTIALVGLIASGKGTVAEMLQKRGYTSFSYGREVEREIAVRQLPKTRNVYQDVSDSLRAEFGPDILARRIAASIGSRRAQGQATRALIDGLRHPQELLWLQTHFDTKIIGVAAISELRFQRFMQRARQSDALTREGFDIADRRDRGKDQPYYGQQGDACMSLVDHLIENDGSVEELSDQVTIALRALDVKISSQ
jgi:dephospho-CoA kinase